MLTTASHLASLFQDPDALPTQSSTYTALAETLKQSYTPTFWDPSRNLFRDNVSTPLCPQDANSIALLFNLTTSEEQANNVSAALEGYWGDLGVIAPELEGTVSPFISGFEVSV